MLYAIFLFFFKFKSKMNLEPFLQKAIFQQVKKPFKPNKPKIACIKSIQMEEHNHPPVDTVFNALLHKSANTHKHFEKYLDHSHDFA